MCGKPVHFLLFQTLRTNLALSSPMRSPKAVALSCWSISTRMKVLLLKIKRRTIQDRLSPLDLKVVNSYSHLLIASTSYSRFTCWPTVLRLVFPAVQENASAVTILPTFLQVCGRKIDNTAAVLDRARLTFPICDVYLSYCTGWSDWTNMLFDRTSSTRRRTIKPPSSGLNQSILWQPRQQLTVIYSNLSCLELHTTSCPCPCRLRLAKQIEIQRNHMQDIYNKLEQFQKDCAVHRTARC